MQFKGLPRRKFKNRHQARKWEITRLAKEVEARLGVVCELEQEQEKLRFEHDLLEELADTFAWLRVQQAGEQFGDDCDATAAAAAPAAAALVVDEREARLLAQMPPVGAASTSADDIDAQPPQQQLQPQQPQQQQQQQQQPAPPPSSVWPPWAPGAPPWREQVAAPIDAASSFGLMRHVLSRPLHPRAAGMTLPELLQEYGAVVRTVALSLQQLDVTLAAAGAGGGGGDEGADHGGDGGDDDVDNAVGAAALRRMQEGILDHMHLLASLVMLQRTEVVALSCLANWETGEVLSGHEPGLYRRLLRLLPLSCEQQRRIAFGAQVFSRLIAAAHAESTALQLQLSGGDAAAGGRACSPLGAAPSMADALRRLADADAAEATLARLRRAMAKDYVLRMACACSTYSPLTYLQLARLVVCAAPRIFVSNQFAAAVVAAWQEAGGQAAAAPSVPAGGGGGGAAAAGVTSEAVSPAPAASASTSSSN